jgi:hypothetical protein
MPRLGSGRLRPCLGFHLVQGDVWTLWPAQGMHPCRRDLGRSGSPHPIWALISHPSTPEAHEGLRNVYESMISDGKCWVFQDHPLTSLGGQEPLLGERKGKRRTLLRE